MSPRIDVRQKLVRIADTPDDRIDVAGAALVLASIDRPSTSVEPYRRHLDRLTDEVRAYVGGDDDDVEMRAEGLVQVLARRYGYRGAAEAAEDPEAANLMRVIDRRTGVAVALGVIYLHVARALGWSIEGLGFPARFLVRLEHDGRRLILDPFGGGRRLETQALRELHKAQAGNQAELSPSLYHPLDNRLILIRIQDHVKSRLLRQDRLEDALETVETMLLFAPHVAGLWREAGLINARLDKVKEAVAALEEYMRHDTGDAIRYRTSILLQELRGRLN